MEKDKARMDPPHLLMEGYERNHTGDPHLKSHPRLRGASVLVVDDNLGDATLATIWLKRLGCRVTVARSGEDALHAVRDEPFDLVLMDLALPEMDGFEATQQIRSAQNQTLRSAIVALTGNLDDELSAICEEAGMDDLLRKPFTAACLRDAMIVALGV